MHGSEIICGFAMVGSVLFVKLPRLCLLPIGPTVHFDMTNHSAPFMSPQDLLQFADKFLEQRIRTFRKDMRVCLRANASEEHAYFPALMACVTFLDLFSGLYAGTVKQHGLKEFLVYMEKFVDASKIHYGTDEVIILYEAFRHKIAHLGQPYFVYRTFDMGNAASRLYAGSKLSLTWTVCKRRRNYCPIEIRADNGQLRSLTPSWPVPFDHRMWISIEHIRKDAINSVTKNGGYSQFLKQSTNAQSTFAKCMTSIFPQ